MFWTYILQSEKNGRYYIGSTDNLDRRIAEHNRGKTTSTALMRPWKVVFTQVFSTLKEARAFEHTLKKQKSRNIIEGLLAKGG